MMRMVSNIAPTLLDWARYDPTAVLLIFVWDQVTEFRRFYRDVGVHIPWSHVHFAALHWVLFLCCMARTDILSGRFTPFYQTNCQNDSLNRSDCSRKYHGGLVPVLT